MKNSFRIRVPKIRIEKHKGLSDKQVAEIKKNLEELAVSKVGEVMVFELVQYVQVRCSDVFSRFSFFYFRVFFMKMNIILNLFLIEPEKKNFNRIFQSNNRGYII